LPKEGIAMLTQLRQAVLIFIALSIVTGVLYPLAVTAVAYVVFPHAAHGSVIINEDGQPVGSELIGQPFSDRKYFWGRPSATGPFPYNSMADSGSNLGPTNPGLIDAVQQRVAKLCEADPDNDQPVPVDLVTASASGLDPHISPAAAYYQIPRVARQRGLSEEEVRRLVGQLTERRVFGVLGQERVHVLKMNRALDALSADKK
jgi:K+-transporting ATPase ATPase C chain